MLRVEHDVIGMCGTNTYYLFNEDNGEAVIVDPAGDPMRIRDRITASGARPTAILVTHGHFDHVLALDDIRDMYKIPAYIGNNEEGVLHDASANLSRSFTGKDIILDADVYVKDGQEFQVAGCTVQALEVPGHTVGGMCYYFKDEGILFSGDTLFCESVGRSDFPGGSASALVRGIKNKLFVLPDDTMVYPGHMEETTIGSEKKYNPFCL